MPISVPQIKGLTVEDFVCFIETEVDYGVHYLPKLQKKLHWIGNRLSIYAFYKLYQYRQYFWPTKFKEMISKAIKDKEKFNLDKNSIEIIPDPRIVNVLNSSSMLSSKF